MPCVMPLGHDIYINKFASFSLKLFEIQRLMEEAGWKKRAEFRGERDIRWGEVHMFLFTFDNANFEHFRK